MKLFFLVRTSAGRENNVVDMVYARALVSDSEIYSIIAPDKLKGYIFIEADSYAPVEEVTQGLRYVKSVVHGVIPLDEILPYFGELKIIESLEKGDLVEITGGVFRRMRAKVIEVDVAKNEATIELEESGSQFPITISADYLKLVEKAKK